MVHFFQNILYYLKQIPPINNMLLFLHLISEGKSILNIVNETADVAVISDHQIRATETILKSDAGRCGWKLCVCLVFTSFKNKSISNDIQHFLGKIYGKEFNPSHSEIFFRIQQTFRISLYANRLKNNSSSD